MSRWILALVIGYCGMMSAVDFGTMGQTFPIAEESLLEVFQKKLGKGLYRVIAQAKERLEEKAKNPLPVAGIKAASNSRTFQIDLSFNVAQDIQDSTGKVIVKAGTTINPLQRIKLSSGLLFLEGSRKEQLVWARPQTGHFKWILVNGKPIEVEEREKRPIYFDQKGAYTSRFTIEHVPAKVIQQGEHLLVEEVVLEEEK